ncbi:alpha-(1,3)-fucosyltransferase C-like [Oppia nitens]|uniref:alpha-(1,3)-fucosyltransferase C-like n=1 Tax=Oppia nitens TaxID=1686743 RepID=UPI0023DA0DA0|nr:alpha-(1,3)-fucosyltransferase C-like [Oppia nitens]
MTGHRLAIKFAKSAILWLVVVWIMFLVTTVWKSYKTKIIINRTLVVDNNTNNNSGSHHIILFWTKYFGSQLTETGRLVSDDGHNNCMQPRWWSQFDETTDDKELAFGVPTTTTTPPPLSQCMVTSDRSYLSVADAVVFHWRDINIDDMPPVRHGHQLWILYNMEAPTHTNNIFSLDSDGGGSSGELAFNWTVTYRQDSDVYVPYGQLVKRLKPIAVLPEVNFIGKTRTIAWFVSNCETPGHREQYVKQLSKYIDVDIIGKCGQQHCDPPRSRHCYERIAKDYKFYLSFENSICRDYVTEKLFAPLNHYIIPVVFGGSDYRQYMPYKSYIDANGQSPQQLARLLQRLAGNQTEYLSYFDWKQYFTVIGGDDDDDDDDDNDGWTTINVRAMCRLCRSMNSRTLLPLASHGINSGRLVLTKKFYTSAQLRHWWFSESQCKAWTDIERYQ